MSIHHENMAWEVELPAIRKVVLLCVARLAHLNTAECNPTVQALAFRCGLSESAVRSSLDDLVQLGHLESLKVPGKGRVFRVALGAKQPEVAA